MKKTLVNVLLTLVLVAAPLAYIAADRFVIADQLEMKMNVCENTLNEKEAQELATAADPLFYDLNGLNVAVSKKQVSFTDLFTAKDLYSRVENCNQTLVEGYIDELVSSFEGKSGYQYKFTSNTDPDESYVVTLFPNVHEYKAIKDFHADFPACDAGLTGAGNMNTKWLRFNSSCGAGYGEELPTLSCVEISQKLSLEFN